MTGRGLVRGKNTEDKDKDTKDKDKDKEHFCNLWQYGLCDKKNCKKQHCCGRCRKPGKQQFGNNLCHWCYIKTCFSECFIQIVFMICFLVNIGSKLYTGIFYIAIGEI